MPSLLCSHVDLICPIRNAQQAMQYMHCFVFQAIDDDCNQTGQMIAALLDWPQVGEQLMKLMPLTREVSLLSGRGVKRFSGESFSMCTSSPDYRTQQPLK
jgi:hypothetical protein